ncbi:MAG: hypothetical protein ABI939_03305 [Anaerolineaceae bacterium]
MSGRRLATVAHLAVGPLALAGFFLPWAHGPGILAANEFTGFTLVGFAGRLQQLNLSLTVGTGLWIVRLAILCVAVAGAWQTLLAPLHRWHLGYALSGWYLVVFAAAATVVGVAKSGLVVPPFGLALVITAGVIFLGTRWATPR